MDQRLQKLNADQRLAVYAGADEQTLRAVVHALSSPC